MSRCGHGSCVDVHAEGLAMLFQARARDRLARRQRVAATHHIVFGEAPAMPSSPYSCQAPLPAAPGVTPRHEFRPSTRIWPASSRTVSAAHPAIASHPAPPAERLRGSPRCGRRTAAAPGLSEPAGQRWSRCPVAKATVVNYFQTTSVRESQARGSNRSRQPTWQRAACCGWSVIRCAAQH